MGLFTPIMDIEHKLAIIRIFLKIYTSFEFDYEICIRKHWAIFYRHAGENRYPGTIRIF